jgi:hypothetical protein
MLWTETTGRDMSIYDGIVRAEGYSKNRSPAIRSQFLESGFRDLKMW